MLHILWLVLKMIGFLILGILGLLLGLVLLVLLVPVRYLVDGSYDGKPKGMVRVTWLLHMLSVRVSYEEELQIELKMFGFRMFRDKGDIADEVMDETMDDAMVEMQEVLEKTVKDPILDAVQEKPPIGQEPKEAEPTEQEPPPHREADETQKKTGLLEKIKFLFQSVCDKLKHVSNIWNRIQEFMQNPDNQYTFHLILRQIKSLLRHILPQKAEGTFVFGFDDPYTTGQVLSVASIVHAWYGDRILITPVFDESILEGDLRLKGRIRIGTILVLGLRILMNKNFRILLKRWRSKGGFSDGR